LNFVVVIDVAVTVTVAFVVAGSNWIYAIRLQLQILTENCKMLKMSAIYKYPKLPPPPPTFFTHTLALSLPSPIFSSMLQHTT